MAANNLTSLSAGLLIRDLLVNDAGVMAVCGKVFPVVAEASAVLPYICYRRGASAQTPAKAHQGADVVTVELLCYAATYAQGIQMAEAVRAAMDNVQADYEDGSGNTLVARSIMLDDSQEGWTDDAYFQSMTFIVKI